MGKTWELDLPANKMLVLLAMGDHADHNGDNVYPGMALIAYKTGYSERQVKRIVAQLVKDGILVEHKGRSTLGTKMYSIDVDAGTHKPPYESAKRSDKMSHSQSDKMSLHEKTDEVTNGAKRSDISTPTESDIPAKESDMAVSPNPSLEPSKDNPSLEPSITTTTLQGPAPENGGSSGGSPAIQNISPDLARVAKAYEANIGLLTPIMRDTLLDAIAEYTADWVDEAIIIAVKAEKRFWNYVEGILKSWKRDGKTPPSIPPVPPAAGGILGGDLTDEERAQRAPIPLVIEPTPPVLLEANGGGKSRQDAWESAMSQLEIQLDRDSFQTWLRGAQLVDWRDGAYIIQARNSYARDMCQHRLYKNIQRLLTDCGGGEVKLQFEVAADKETP